VSDFVEQHSSFAIHLMWVFLITLVGSQLLDQSFKQFLAWLEERLAHDNSVVFELFTV
jgi:hypothetical protein